MVEEERKRDAVDPLLVLLVVERVAACSHEREVRGERLRLAARVLGPARQRSVDFDVGRHCILVRERVRHQRLAEAGAVGGVAPTDDRRHLRAAPGRRHLREVDDLDAVELGVVRRLAEARGERVEQRLDDLAAVELLVVREGDADEFEPEPVAAALVVLGEAGAAEGRERAMQARLRDVDVARQLLQPDAPRVVAEAAQDREHPVGACEPRLLGLTYRAMRERIHESHWNTVPIVRTSRVVEGAESRA